MGGCAEPPDLHTTAAVLRRWQRDKSLYRLKQPARTWYPTLHEHLKAIGFVRTTLDAGVYRSKVECEDTVFHSVYVHEGLAVAGTD